MSKETLEVVWRGLKGEEVAEAAVGEEVSCRQGAMGMYFQWVRRFGTQNRAQNRVQNRPQNKIQNRKLTFRAGFSVVHFGQIWTPKWLGSGNPSDEKN